MLSLDPTTKAEYDAQTTAADRAQAILDALTGTVSCKVYDDTDTVRASGVMASPWATRNGGALVVGALTSFNVSSGGTPTSGWYLRFESGTRYVRGSFGLAGSGAAFTLRAGTFTTGLMCNIGSASVISTAGSSGTGEFAQGASLTLTGSGFGTGGIPALFQDFETGTVGADLSSLGFRTTRSNGGGNPTVSSTYSYSGTKCGVSDCSIGESAAYLGDMNATELYISFHLRPVLFDGAPNTTKGVRALGPITTGENIFSSYPGFIVQEPMVSTNNHRIQINANDSSSASGRQIFYLGNSAESYLSYDAWCRQEYHYKLGAVGVAEGFLRYWKDLVAKRIEENIVTRFSGSENIDRLMLPFYYGNGGGGYFYYDNVYIAHGANCAARVEAGDNSVYTSCTKREVMNTTARTDTSVTFTVPSHTFASGAPVYLFVIDGNNAVVGSAYTKVVA